jgi:hypothetical protein
MKVGLGEATPDPQAISKMYRKKLEKLITAEVPMRLRCGWDRAKTFSISPCLGLVWCFRRQTIRPAIQLEFVN